MGNEDFLWAAIPFMGGISGQQQAPCGAISASALTLGLRYRCAPQEKEKAKEGRTASRYYAARLVQEFTREFGNITCLGLLGLDFSQPGGYQKFRESGLWKDTCEKYVAYLISRLYAYEEEREKAQGD